MLNSKDKIPKVTQASVDIVDCHSLILKYCDIFDIVDITYRKFYFV